MGAASEYDLVLQAADFVLGHVNSVENETEAWLQTHADTPAVNRLRRMAMVRAITAVGTFSLFESSLQQKRGWEHPFRETDRILRLDGLTELANRFEDTRDAINVLKHGRGRSHDALLARRDRLAFEIKGPGERFFNEGNISEGLRLIKVDDGFVRHCSGVIADVLNALKQRS